MITVEQAIAGLETIVNYNDGDEFLMKRIRPAIALLRQQSILEQRNVALRKILKDIGHQEWCDAAKYYGPCNCDIPAALAEVPQK